MNVESRPGSLSGMPDDRLGTVAVSLVVSELRWTPDVAPPVMDRISRDAVAYPEQFDRRFRPPPPPMAPPPTGRSAKRTIGRIAVFGVVLAIVVALVVMVATASAAGALDPDDARAEAVMAAPISAIGTPPCERADMYVPRPVLVDAIGARLAIDLVYRSYHFATEAS